jgi:hypothetical protein
MTVQVLIEAAALVLFERRCHYSAVGARGEQIDVSIERKQRGDAGLRERLDRTDRRPFAPADAVFEELGDYGAVGPRCEQIRVPIERHQGRDDAA